MAGPDEPCAAVPPRPRGDHRAGVRDLLHASPSPLASQAAASARFSANGSDPLLRLIVEHPDDERRQRRNFDEPGALFKAESTGDWSYRGDDPDSDDEVFGQESDDDITDLAPLIEFLEFVNDSDDASFAAELPARLDIGPSPPIWR